MTVQSQSSTPNVVDAALGYSQRGIPVFPADPLDKKPLIKGGFKNATTDENQIRDWWQRWPNAMIGTPTGSASNMWVVDIDRDPVRNIDGTAALAKLISQHGELPQTLMTITPRGGRHLIFVWDKGVEIRNSTGKVGQGIDVRGEGGYVCLPPSRRADGALYQWDPAGASQAVPAPSWLVELARSGNKSKKRDKAWAHAALERECETVAKARPGTRNSSLNAAAFNLFQIVAGGRLDDQEVRDRLFKAAEACGLVADDGAQSVWATIDSAAQAAKGHPRSRPSVKPQSQKQSGRPTIRIIGGELPRVVNEAEAALIAAGGFNLYQRGGLIVRPVLSKLKASNNRETCGRRITKLHLSHRYFLCRHCNKLAYASQYEHQWQRALRKANKIKQRLGIYVGIGDPLLDKPKGMWIRTFDHLLNQMLQVEILANEAKANMFKRLLAQLQDDLK